MSVYSPAFATDPGRMARWVGVGTEQPRAGLDLEVANPADTVPLGHRVPPTATESIVTPRSRANSPILIVVDWSGMSIMLIWPSCWVGDNASSCFMQFNVFFVDYRAGLLLKRRTTENNIHRDSLTASARLVNFNLFWYLKPGCKYNDNEELAYLKIIISF